MKPYKVHLVIFVLALISSVLYMLFSNQSFMWIPMMIGVCFAIVVMPLLSRINKGSSIEAYDLKPETVILINQFIDTKKETIVFHPRMAFKDEKVVENHTYLITIGKIYYLLTTQQNLNEGKHYFLNKDGDKWTPT